MTAEMTETKRAVLRVLIAEDELILAFAMRGQLEQRGVEVVGLATNGKTAFLHCQEFRPDVILMDVRMPGVDGIEATRLIMQHCPACVIVITAFADEETRAKAAAAGAMGFLSKPIQAAGVLEEIPKARARFAEFQSLREEARDLEEALVTRARVEIAKQALIKKGTSPETAFQMLKEAAATAGIPLRAMAERVISRAAEPGASGEISPDGNSPTSS